ncbi:MAG: efflux RND transporter periplasmic adaptor subunit [Thiotrichales bacterium]
MSIKKIIYAVKAIVLVIGLGLAFRGAPVAIELGEVTRAPLQVTIDAEGQTRLKNRFVVSATASGMLERVALDVGDPVSGGQVLAKISAIPNPLLDARTRAQAIATAAAAESAYTAAKKSVDAANSERDFSIREYKRLAALAEKSLVSKEQLDAAAVKKTAASIAAQTAKAQLRRAQEELKAAQAAIGTGAEGEKTDLLSPSDGVIVKRYRESAGFVAVGEPLFEVGNLDELEIVTDVLSADAVRLRPGMRVILHRWGGEADLEGRVRLIEPEGFTKVSSLGVEEQRVLVRSRIISSPDLWEALGDQYRVESSFVVWEGDHVLQVPANAVFRSGAGMAAYTVESGRARERMLKTGESNGLVTEVLEGLNEGDKIILHPGKTVSDGVRVKVVD